MQERDACLDTSTYLRQCGRGDMDACMQHASLRHTTACLWVQGGALNLLKCTLEHQNSHMHQGMFGRNTYPRPETW